MSRSDHLRTSGPSVCLALLLTAGCDSSSTEHSIKTTRVSAYVPQAQLRRLEGEQVRVQGPGWKSGRILLRGHRVLRGDAAVLVHRVFAVDETASDCSSFEMLSIELQEAKPGRHQVPDQARVFYSTGSSVWGLGAYSESAEGIVDLKELPNGSFGVEVRATLRMRDPHAPERSAQTEEVSLSFEAARMELENSGAMIKGQTPWPDDRVPAKFQD